VRGAARNSRPYRDSGQRGTVGTISKRVSQLIVEDLSSCLEQEVRSPKRPLHLLLLHESSADDLVDRRFDKAVLSLSFPLGAGGDSCSFLPEEGGKLVALFAL